MSDEYWKSIDDEIAARRDHRNDDPAAADETGESPSPPERHETGPLPDPWASTEIVGPALTDAQISFLDQLDDQPPVPHLGHDDLTPDGHDETT